MPALSAAVYLECDAGAVGQPLAEDASQERTGGRQRDQLVFRRLEGNEAGIGAIFEAQREAGGGTERFNGRRVS